MESKTARLVIGITGLALVVGFFLPWIDVGFASVSGWQIVKNSSEKSLFWLMLVLAPLGGLAMAATAFSGSRHARLTSVIVGLALVGYGVVKTVHTFFATTGVGLWILIAGACAALAVPLLSQPER